MKVLLIVIIAIGAGVMLFAKKSADNPSGPEDRRSGDSIARWKAVIDAHTQPKLKLRLTGKPASSPSTSKVGGEPYWPSDRAYPISADGQPLRLLAQINFADIEAPLEHYPASGLLQFFIGSDELYGSDFTKPGTDPTKNHNYAVVFHEQLSEERHAGAPAATKSKEDMLPFSGESAIAFEPAVSRVTPMDYRFENILPGVRELYDESEPLYDYGVDSPAHQMGGYAVFTQTDPREYDGKNENWQLLLQLDTETAGDLEMMWGDVGIANFFIRSADLEQRNFSRVWYNWDCH